MYLYYFLFYLFYIADATEMAEDDALLAEVEAEKPEEPKPYNEMQIKAEIEKAALTCRRPPGNYK